jgi:4-oxalocrotonate tautomerase
MPIITIDLIAGRSRQQKEDLARKITTAVVDVCGCKAADVTVLYRDMEKGDWFIEGESLASQQVQGTPSSSEG